MRVRFYSSLLLMGNHYCNDVLPSYWEGEIRSDFISYSSIICIASSDASFINVIWSRRTYFLWTCFRLHFVCNLHYSLYESNAQDSKGGRTSGIIIGSNGRGMIYGMV